MKQLTLDGFEVGGVSCPTCGEPFDTEVAVKAHHQWHDEAYYDIVLENQFGVPPAWLVDALHNILEYTLHETADEIGVSISVVQRVADDYNVNTRDSSEAKKLEWEHLDEETRAARLQEAHRVTRERAEMGEHQWSNWADDATEEEIKAQTAAANKKTRELTARGENYLQQWRKENPDKAQIQAERVAKLGAPARKTNGMEGVTGQDHPKWRGGKSLYDAVKKQLPGRSWYSIRKNEHADECYMCGESAERLAIHHIIPVLAGGTNGEYNRMTLCYPCHGTVEAYTWTNFADAVYDLAE